MAEGKLFIIESNYDQVTAWFRGKNRERMYTWDKSKFLKDVRAGEVWTADVSSSYVALGDHLANQRFFEVETDLLQKVNVGTFVLADSEEDAKKKLIEGVKSGEIKNFADVRRGSYVSYTPEEDID